jgi:hypothetical protein
MVAYFVRRTVGAVVALLLGSFMLYSVIAYIPGGPYYQLSARHGEISPGFARLIVTLELHKPWPLSYLAWMFDPRETLRLDENNRLIPKGINLQLAGFEIRGSGILTGDLGDSIWYLRYPPTTVSDAFGPGWPLPGLFLFALTLLLMAVAVLQRRGRRPAYARARPPSTLSMAQLGLYHDNRYW